MRCIAQMPIPWRWHHRSTKASEPVLCRCYSPGKVKRRVRRGDSDQYRQADLKKVVRTAHHRLAKASSTGFFA
jgi:hypothetical protein